MAPEDCAPPPPPPVESIELTNIDRVTSNLYSARLSFNDIFIETRSCFAFTFSDDGFLIRDALGNLQLVVDNSSGDVCDVVELYTVEPPFGTYSLTAVDQLGSNVYRARSGSATLIIETQLCLALTLLDDGILIWEGIGSQLFIDNSSGDVCDVVSVRGN